MDATDTTDAQLGRPKTSMFTFKSRSKRDHRRSVQRDYPRSGRRSSQLSGASSTRRRTNVISTRTTKRLSVQASKRDSVVLAAVRRTSIIQERESRRTSVPLRLSGQPFPFGPSPPPPPNQSTRSASPSQMASSARRPSDAPLPPRNPSEGSRSFFNRLTSRFRSSKKQKRPSLPNIVVQGDVPASSSAPEMPTTPTIFALVDATARASLSTTSLPAMLASQKTGVRSTPREVPLVHRARSSSDLSETPAPTPRSPLRGETATARGTEGHGEQSHRSPTLATLPSSPLALPVRSFTSSTISTFNEEGSDSESKQKADIALSTKRPSFSVPQIQTSPSLVFSDSDDGVSQPTHSPITPLTGIASSECPFEPPSNQPTQMGGASLQPTIAASSDTAKPTAPIETEKEPPALVISTPSEAAPKQLDPPSVSRSASVTPARERSPVIVEEDEDEGEGYLKEQQAPQDPFEDGKRLQPVQDAARTRKLSDKSVHYESLPPKREGQGATVKRSSTLALLTRGPSMLFGKRDKSPAARPATVYAVSTEQDSTPAPAATTRKTSVMRTKRSDEGRRPVPVRAQTIRAVMTNADIGRQMDGYWNIKTSLDGDGDDTAKEAPTIAAVASPVVDQETQHLTEVAFF